ncbi:MAG: hypothetical protein LR015_10285 [Verrucomicrobia bacterium]|nr:hypothetical protein [Verrucomicrobiota bacterium]
MRIQSFASVFRLCIVKLLLLVLFTSAVNARVIPAEDFFRTPQFRDFTISPDGNSIAMIGEWNSRQNLFVFDLATREGRRITSYRRNNVLGVTWANNERILYFMDDDGNESLGIFAVNRDGSRPRVLVRPFSGRPQGVGAFRRTVIIDRLVNEPNHVLVTNNDRHLEYPDVFRMNINTGDMSIVLRNPGDVLGWSTDWDGVIRFAAFSDRNSGVSGVRYRASADSDWIELATFGDDAPSWSPLGFSQDGKSLIVRSNMDSDLAGDLSVRFGIKNYR